MANAFQQRKAATIMPVIQAAPTARAGLDGEPYADHRDLALSEWRVSRHFTGAPRLAATSLYVQPSLPPWRIIKGTIALLRISAAAGEPISRGIDRRTKAASPDPGFIGLTHPAFMKGRSVAASVKA